MNILQLTIEDRYRLTKIRDLKAQQAKIRLDSLVGKYKVSDERKISNPEKIIETLEGLGIPNEDAKRIYKRLVSHGALLNRDTKDYTCTKVNRPFRENKIELFQALLSNDVDLIDYSRTLTDFFSKTRFIKRRKP